jgi:hypothetical protein
MRRLRALTVLAVVACLCLSADVAQAALAKAQGGSGFSGTLSSNKAIRKQQLIADPDYPTAGSTSTTYNPGVVSFSGLIFGPGYYGWGYIEIESDDSTFLVDIDTWLASPFGNETGYLQVHYTDTPPTSVSVVAPNKGQITPPAGYLQVDRGGPVSVDTHAMFFDFLSEVPDGAVAEYTIYADTGTRNNEADYIAGIDEQGKPYRLNPGDIAPVTVRGNLNAIPLPPAVFIGGITMAGIAVVRRFRGRAVA